MKQGSEGHNVQATGMASTVDLSTLAHVSEGYTAGSIYRSVKTTLTPRRVHRIVKRPLLSSEFLGVLAQQQQLLKKNVQASFHLFRTFFSLLYGGGTVQIGSFVQYGRKRR